MNHPFPEQQSQIAFAELRFDTVSNNNRVNSTGFSYDLSGNLSANGPATSFTYNQENFLTAAGATTYQYDAQGRRVRKTVGSTVTDYFYSGSEVLAEKQGANWTDYIFFGAQRIAKQTGATASTASYLHADHLRSTRVCTDANGNSTGTCDYEPFGEIQQGSTCSVPTNYRFAGMEWDADAGPNGLYHTWFRQYDVNQGRWMSVDPLPGSPEDPQSLNRYAYVRNDPVDFIDPLGLRCIVWWNFTWVPEKKSEDPDKEIPGHWELSSVDSWCFADPGGERRCRGPECKEEKPDKPPKKQGTAARIACAAKFGQNHSIAAAFGAQNSFVGNLLGGNTFSGLVGLGQTIFGNSTPTGSSIATTILSGAGQGLPGGGPGFKGAAGLASDAIVGRAVSAGYNAITGVGQGTLELGVTASGRVASIATPLLQTTVGTIVGYANLAKLALDAGTFAYGAIFACRQ